MKPFESLLLLPGLVVGITLHEFAHAWAGSLLGDDYARRQGRVSLNPLRHLAPLGTLAILFLPFGWGRPVPVNLYNFNRPRRDYLLCSLAGPLANILVVGVCFLLMLATGAYYGLGALGAATLELAHMALMLVALINAMLAAINLLPLPPLDGSKIWPCVIPALKPSFGKKTNMISLLILVALLWSGSLRPALTAVLDTVYDMMPASKGALLDNAIQRGGEAFDRHDYAAAERHFTEALGIDPAAHPWLHLRAVSRHFLGKKELALADINRAIGLNGDTPSYYECRALVHESLGREDLAEADYARADALRAATRPASAPSAATGQGKQPPS